MWTFFALALVLLFLRAKIVRIAKNKGRSPWPYVIMLLTPPMLAAIGGVFGGNELADFLNRGDGELLFFLANGLAIGSYIIAIWFTFWLTNRGPCFPRTTNGSPD
jgi:hypothetical protein